MELKALILGLLFSIGIFALKSGTGLYYAAIQKKGIFGKTLLVLTFIAVYVGLFGLSFFVLGRINLVRHLDFINGLLRAGMLIHLVLAAFTAVWGVVLLKEGSRYSLGWLTLSVPCPVCMIVIFSTSAFLMSIFPEALGTAFYLATGSFVAVVLFTFFVMHSARKGLKGSPESLLGGAMLAISGYFILSAMIIPQVSDIERIYRLSMQNAAQNTGRGLTTVLILFLLTAVPGFFWTLMKIRRIKTWT
ncbi:MAG: DUF2162 family putative transporter [Dissulfurimicrobium sp.]|uniref:DUF2162 family putative transporter n=1 Tax=Dissulfurimicrobium TaxID=1769732 RepID=UPI001EDC689D|nr:DUF2162 family putative transporter [Dissulfurimicrobium hydrothermale]UKL12958.1 DUF2162 domain-containing protein [Dissulfurimicrobium hydrothermale]